MTFKVEFGTEKTFASPSPTDVSWSPSQTPIEELIEGEQEDQSTVDDCIYRDFTSATIHNEAIVSIENQVEGSYSFTSTDTDVATVNSAGRVSWVSDGTTGIVVRGPRGAKRIEVEVSEEGGTTSTQFESFVPGSLNHHQATLLEGLVEGKTPGAGSNLNLYTTYSLATNTYTRNVNVWTEGLDLTAWVTRSDQGNYYKPGTLITPAHILHVGHNPFNPGETVWFVDNSNNAYSRTVTAIVNLMIGPPQYDLGGNWDFAISTLSSDLPESISPAQIVPADWKDYFPSIEDEHPRINKGNGIRVLYSDRQKGVWTGDVPFWHDSSPLPGIGMANPIDTGNNNPLVGWNKAQAVVGDSGNTGCLHIDNRLVVLGNYCGGGNIQGPEMGVMIDIIQDITSNGAEIADFTSFTNYA